ncbi:MAG: hypothetical protein U0670_10105 [Anaerolineae bacterium]
MPFEVKQLGNEPIIIVTIIPPVNMQLEPTQRREAANAIARDIDGPVYRITDVTRFEPTFDMIVGGMALDIRHSERNIRHIFVGKGEMVELVANAIKQPQYGAQEGSMVGSMDEALALARKQLNG